MNLENRKQNASRKRSKNKGSTGKAEQTPRTGNKRHRKRKTDRPPKRTTAETIKADYKAILRTGKASKAGKHRKEGRTATGKLYPKKETQTRRNHAQKPQAINRRNSAQEPKQETNAYKPILDG